MTKLITIADIKLYKALSSNINALKIDSEINEAQEFDLRPLLGDEFFMALLDDFNASPSLSTYDDLFNGSTYTYQGNTYQHDGLKAMLCYYAYARYKLNSNSNNTAYGTVEKLTTESKAVSEKTISRQVTQTLNGAKIYENRVMDFLKRNKADYPLFKCENRQPQSNGIRITAIRKDR